MDDVWRLDGRVALITGGSRNIGKAMAEQLASAGAEVFVVARDEQRLLAVRDEVASRTGGRVEAMAADLMTDVDAVVEAVTAAMGGVDILVNNVPGASGGGPVPLLETTQERVDAGLRLNIMVPLLLTRALVNGMRERGHGVVLNLVSTAGFVPVAGRAFFGVTKAALWMMTRYLAAELAPDIRVNALCPGTVSETGESMNPIWDRMVDRIPLQRFGSAAELAPTALFLVSDASRYTTGECVFVDGGRVNASPMG